MGYTRTKYFIGCLQFRFNWLPHILSGNPVSTATFFPGAVLSKTWARRETFVTQGQGGNEHSFSIIQERRNARKRLTVHIGKIQVHSRDGEYGE